MSTFEADDEDLEARLPVEPNGSFDWEEALRLQVFANVSCFMFVVVWMIDDGVSHRILFALCISVS